jgi:hypothetical protein
VREGFELERQAAETESGILTDLAKGQAGNLSAMHAAQPCPCGLSMPDYIAAEGLDEAIGFSTALAILPFVR